MSRVFATPGIFLPSLSGFTAKSAKEMNAVRGGALELVADVLTGELRVAVTFHWNLKKYQRRF